MSPARRRPPGRGCWLRHVQQSAPDCVAVAEYIAARVGVFADDVPAELREQFAQLEHAHLVHTAPDGFVFRGHGSRNTSSRLGGRNHDDNYSD